MGMLVNPYRHGPSYPSTLNHLFTGGETGDHWVFDNVHTNAASDGANITTATGLVNGRVMTNPGTAPKLRSLSGKWAMDSNGSGVRLHHNFGSAVAQPGTIIICLQDSSVATHIIATGDSSSSRWQINNDSSGNIIMYAGSTLDTTLNEPPADPVKVFTAEFNGASSKFRSNGTQTATGNAGTQSTAQLTIAALYDGTFNGAFYTYSALFINRILTAGELDGAERLLGSYAGLTW